MNAVSKLSTSLLCVVMFGTSIALGADLPAYSVPAKVDPVLQYVAPKASTWSGFYAGAHLGGGFVNMPAGNDRDFAWGLQAGYNYQFDQFVIGAELEGTRNNRLRYSLPGGGALEQSWTGVAKARAGVAFDNVLLFGAAGVAAARFEKAGTVTSEDRWQAGLAFGGGVEVAFNEHLSGKLEYTQTRFNNVPSAMGAVGRSDNLVQHAVQAGLNFRF